MISLFKTNSISDKIITTFWIISTFLFLYFLFTDNDFYALIFITILGIGMIISSLKNTLSKTDRIKNLIKTERINGVYNFRNLSFVFPAFVCLSFLISLDMLNKGIENLPIFILCLFYMFENVFPYFYHKFKTQYCLIFTDKICYLFWEHEEEMAFNEVRKTEIYKHYLRIYSADDKLSIDLLKLTVEQGKDIFEKLTAFSTFYKFEISENLETYYDS